jgi:ATP-dependent Clp protease ATP-binding subunit ClpX
MPDARRLPLQLYQATGAVLGQEEARKRLAMLFQRQADVLAGRYPEAVGVLVFGRTGVGKTMCLREMAARCGLPFATVDATMYTDKGYVGPDLTQMFLPLIRDAMDKLQAQQSGQQVEYRDEEQSTSLFGRPREEVEAALHFAERGVILLDEFDKWLVRGNDQSGRNIGRQLQAELLNMVQGATYYVTDTEEELGEDFDTSRVMIVCCGAFTGLAPLLESRLDMSNLHEETMWEQVEPKDFEHLGILPELSGRLASHVAFKPLNAEHLAQILRLEGGLLDEYTARFAAEGCRLQIGEAAVSVLGRIAHSRGTGARGLRHVMEQLTGIALFKAAEWQAQGRRSISWLDVQAADRLVLDVEPV